MSALSSPTLECHVVIAIAEGMACGVVTGCFARVFTNLTFSQGAILGICPALIARITSITAQNLGFSQEASEILMILNGFTSGIYLANKFNQFLGYQNISLLKVGVLNLFSQPIAFSIAAPIFLPIAIIIQYLASLVLFGSPSRPQ